MNASYPMSGKPAARDDDVPQSKRGPAPRHVVVGYGFWLFLLSDIVLFAVLFAAHAVLSHHSAGGPTGATLFHRRNVLIETACLLTSSFTCGMFSIAIEQRRRVLIFVFGAATFALGAAFLGLELTEFAGMLAMGAGPSRSAFLSSFFALVGMHGLHVTAGLAWLLVMMLQIVSLGLTPMVTGRLRCFSLFWHALDIVWIGVFTIVYLGVR